MATTVGFVSEKGGVGKTTACYHLAVALSQFEGKKAMVVDTDYQRGGLTCRMFPSKIEAFRSGKVTDVTLFDRFEQLYGGGIGQPKSVDVLRAVGKYGHWGVSVIPADSRLADVTVGQLPHTKSVREGARMRWRHLKLIDDVLHAQDDVLRGPHSDFDYILIDTHPELSDLLSSVVYACDYCVSPVKLDQQSSIGVPSAIEAIGKVNEEMEWICSSLKEVGQYTPTRFVGAIGMMAREYGGVLKESERVQFRQLRAAKIDVFDTYITEGDGLRQAAEQRCPVFDLATPNAKKQSDQFKRLTKEFIRKCPPK